MEIRAAIAYLGEVGWSRLSDDAKETLFANKYWRMNNLYFIRDANGKEVVFRMNSVQRELYDSLWYLTVILKARQQGFTTFIDLYLLDECLFNRGIEAGIVAHNLDDASKIFRRKIKFPYSRLPGEVKELVYPTTDSKTELVLSNESVVSVGVSYRSGTCQYLHISEYGKISAKMPDKAIEIKTGAIESVAPGQVVVIESTAEGRGGEFYELVKTARALADSGQKLTNMDFKFHFSPWFKERRYTMADHDRVVITSDMAQYFDDLRRGYGIELTPGQKAWYSKKALTLREKMRQEYPSTPDEAFDSAVRGAYWANEIRTLRQQKRIRQVPHDPALLVHTAWDLGRRDDMAIWFIQEYGGQYRVIDYYENNGESPVHYVGMLRAKTNDLKYHYGNHYMPHDIEVTDLSQLNNLSRKQVFESLGVDNIVVVKRESDLRNMEGVSSVRMLLPKCFFDEARTERGLAALEAYAPEWDDKHDQKGDRPEHNWASHASSAFIQFARGYSPVAFYSDSDIMPDIDGEY